MPDSGLAGILLDELDELAADIDLVPHLVVEVGAVEGTLEYPGVHHVEVLLDVCLYLGSGRGRQGYDGGYSELLHDAADVAVLGSEIVAPLGYTVGLVYGVERDFDLFQQRNGVVLGQGLGSHVQQLGDPAQEVVLDFLDLALVEGRVEKMRDTLRAGYETSYRVHLVLHKGDEGRYHNRCSRHHKGGQLVAQ